jgi:hypothetical protein
MAELKNINHHCTSPSPSLFFTSNIHRLYFYLSIDMTLPRTWILYNRNTHERWTKGSLFLLLIRLWLTMTNIYLFASLLFLFSLEQMQWPRISTLWYQEV